MKEYELWTNGSGADSIVGIVDDETGTKLLEEWQECKESASEHGSCAWPFAFEDADGLVRIDMEQVALLNVRDIREKKVIGFCQS